MSELKTVEDGLHLPKSVIKAISIPTQFVSEAEAKAVVTTGEAASATLATTLSGSFIINLLAANSLGAVWSAVNCLQLI